MGRELPIPTLGPESVTWRMGREAAMLAGGGRALLLQVAHPQVAAGVSEHSDYAARPWGRLQRTLEVYNGLIFGDDLERRIMVDTLHGVHKRVHGRDNSGRPYHALRPDLLLWVHATLVDTRWRVYEHYFAPLTAAEKDQYWQEQQQLGAACGIPDGAQPATWDEFRAYWQEQLNHVLQPSATLSEVAATIRTPPAPMLLGSAAERLWTAGSLPLRLGVRLTTTGLAPLPLRQMLGLRWTPVHQGLYRAQTHAGRALLPNLPPRVRFYPAAQRAYARQELAAA